MKYLITIISILVLCSSCNKNTESSSIDIHIRKTLNQNERSLISSYIWNVLGGDTVVWTTEMEGVTLFTVDSPFSESETLGLLGPLKLEDVEGRLFLELSDDIIKAIQKDHTAERSNANEGPLKDDMEK